jgi:hypothetical protein
MKIQTSIIGLSLVAFMMMSSGCSSSSDATVTETSPIKKSGSAFDGAISGAKVCVDVNENSQCDINEDSTITNLDGTYSLTTTQTGSLLVIGGIDMGTGEAFTGILKAPADSTVISPLTSMVAAMITNGSTADEAETTLKKSLGIASNVDLTNYNPFEKADANDEDAQAVLAAQAQIQTLVQASSATIAGADNDTKVSDVMSNVTLSLAKSLQVAANENPDSTIDISADMVSEATKDAASTVFANNTVAQVAAKSSAESMAAYSVAQANIAKTTIEDGDLASAVTNLNASMILANDTLETKATTTTQDILTQIQDQNLDDATLENLAQASNINIELEDSNITPVEVVVDEDEITSALENKTADAETAAEEQKVAEATQDCTTQGGTMDGDICQIPELPTGSIS